MIIYKSQHFQKSEISKKSQNMEKKSHFTIKCSISSIADSNEIITYFDRYSVLSLVRTPGYRRNLFALSEIRINRCLKY